MKLNISIRKDTVQNLQVWFAHLKMERLILLVGIILAISATTYAFTHDLIVAYGDAESHLNIAKRVIHSITPGFAQLGGIWLPLPHILMIPLVYFDTLWRTGLAGSIVSGIAYVISAIYMYKLTRLLTRHRGASFMASLIFMLNPNILYLQTTPMTEMPLIAFFILSTYFFILYLRTRGIKHLLLAAFYGFCATLSRYDGWFLVMIEAGILFLLLSPFGKQITSFDTWKKIPVILKSLVTIRHSKTTEPVKRQWLKMEGAVVLFSTLAFFGIVLWLGWDALILGDPLYFTHSEFSAKSQQQGWQAVGQLPAYSNLWLSFLYYFVSTMSNSGVIVFFVALVGLLTYLVSKENKYRWFITVLLMTPFIFYVITLYMGQSIIFIPHLTPSTFDWTLFNVRYGVVMVPAVAFFIGYLFSKITVSAKLLIIGLLLANIGLFGIGYSQVISLQDGAEGLSHAELHDAENWIKVNYDNGLVLFDDFSRLTSIVRSGIPMQNVIYVGNKPYWEDSLLAPEAHATWLVLQKDDKLWKKIWEPENMQKRVYAYFTKVYTSPEILIFKRTSDLMAQHGQ